MPNSTFIVPQGYSTRPTAFRNAQFGSSDGNELATQRLDLDTKKLSLEQMRALTQMTELVLSASAARYKMSKELNENFSSAIAVKRLGDLNPTSQDYEKQRAAILYEHSDAFSNPVLRQTIESQDILYRQHAASQENFQNQTAIEQQKIDARKALAEQTAPFNQATAARNLSAALKNLDTIASQFGKPNPKTGAVTPIPPELQDFKTYVTKLGAALTKPTDPTANALASPTPQPLPLPTPAATVSTQSALDFLTKALGQTSPPAAAQSPAPAAAISGKPDAAEAQLSTPND
jgi:hypothetical protein